MLDAGSFTKLLPIPPKRSQYQTLKLKIRSREPAFTTRFISETAKPPPKKRAQTRRSIRPKSFRSFSNLKQKTEA